MRPAGDLSPLTRSLVGEGQALPLVVRRRPSGSFQVLDGFRRIEALVAGGARTAEAWTFESLPDEEAVVLCLALNGHRAEVTGRDLSRFAGSLSRAKILTEAARTILLDRIAEVTLRTPAGRERGGRKGRAVELPDLVRETIGDFRKVSWSLDRIREHWGDVALPDRERILSLCRYVRELAEWLERSDTE